MADPTAGAAISTLSAAAPAAAAAAAARRDAASFSKPPQEDRVRKTTRRATTDLFKEVNTSSYERIRDVLLATSNVNMEYGTTGQNLIFFAAARKDNPVGSTLQVLRLLVEEYGLNATKEDKIMSQTPLFYAACKGAVDRCAYLVECRCNPDHRDRLVQSPMFYAVRDGHQACAEFLLSRQCPIDPVDQKGQTPLFYAAAYGHTDLVRWLVQQRADVHRVDTFGKSLLFNTSSKCAAALLEESCNPNTADNDGKTALMYAVLRGDCDVTRLLARYGAPLNTTDRHSWTALFHAAKGGHVACCKLLTLELGADVHHKDPTGRTARDAAEKFGKQEAAQCLQNVEAEGGHPRAHHNDLTAPSAPAERMLRQGPSSAPVDQSASQSDLSHTPRTSPRSVASQASAASVSSAASAASAASGAFVEDSPVSVGSAEEGAEAGGVSSENSGPGGGNQEGQQPLANGLSEEAAKADATAAAATAAAATPPLAVTTAQPPTPPPVRTDPIPPKPEPRKQLATEQDKHLAKVVSEMSPRTVQNCLDARTDPQTVAMAVVGRGQNLVFVAATRSQEARRVCELLVEYRVDPAQKDTQLEQTALFFAVRNHEKSGGIDCARYLINQRCDPDHVDTQCQTPLFYAAQRPDTECLQALIDAGAQPNRCDRIGQTAVFYAASVGAEKCMKVLLMARADATVHDASGQTALFYCKSPSVAELLLEHRCNANLRDNSGLTALSVAASMQVKAKTPDVTCTLLKLRCDPDATDNNGETSLFYAAKAARPNDAVEACRILVEGGADVLCRNNKGLTAADKTNHNAVRKLLARYVENDRPARKRSLEASNGVGCNGNASQVSTERDTRRKCILIFEDPRGTTIDPGSPEYLAALRELVAECPWLNGWGSALL